MVKQRSPAETRQVICAHCDAAIEIPASAMSVNCRHCNQRLIIENMKIKAYHAVVRLATAGRVEVARKARLVAEVRVSELIVDGIVQGNVRAVERVVVGKKGRILGDVCTPRLLVQPGGQLSGQVQVGRSAAPGA
ncbi:MAG: polymer-forming cytoskeletal protein [Planctomycetota bacterium]